MTLTQIAMWGGAALVALTAGTYLLPRHVQVERSAKVAADPGAILALAASNEGYQRFNPYKTMDPNLKIEMFVEYQIDLGSMGQPKQTMKVTPTAGGSDVVWTMNADMGMNPIGRVIGLFMEGMVGKNLETGLANLSATLKNS
jgi:Polyketide cyclase / dehydrase and lipid transport